MPTSIPVQNITFSEDQQKTIDLANATVRVLKEQELDLIKSKKQLEQDNAALVLENSGLEVDKKKLLEEIDGLRSSEIELSRRVDVLKSDISSLSTERANYRAEIVEAKQELEKTIQECTERVSGADLREEESRKYCAEFKKYSEKEKARFSKIIEFIKENL